MASLIRHAVAQLGGTTQLTVSLPDSATGNKLVLGTAMWAAYQQGSVPNALYLDGSGQSFDKDAQGPLSQIGAPDQGQQVTVWSLDAPGGALTVHVQFPGDCYGQVVLAEYSGVAPGAGALDKAKTAGANNGSNFSPAIAAGADTAATEASALVFAILGVTAPDSNSLGIDAATPGYSRVAVDQDGGSYAGYAVDWKTAGGAGQQQSVAWGDLNSNGEAWSAALVVYRPAAGVEPPPQNAAAPSRAFTATGGIAAPAPTGRRNATPPARAITATASYVAVPATSGSLAIAPARAFTAGASFFAPNPAGMANTTAPARAFSATVAFATPTPGLRANYVVGGYVAAGYVTDAPPVVPPPGEDPGGIGGLLQTFVRSGAFVVRSGAFHTLRSKPPNTVPPDTSLEPVYPNSAEVFYDDFSGVALDRAKWKTVLSGVANAGAFEYEPAAVTLNNGLTISTYYRDGVWRSGGIGQGYVSNGFDGFQYGQVSVRARVDAGRGYGPALMLWPADDVWDAEIDIVLSPDPQKQAVWNIVRGNPPLTNQDGQSLVVDATQWHTYTCRWEADRTTFYLDGTEVRAVSTIFVQQPMGVALRGFVAGPGDGFYGDAPNDFSTKRIRIGYVRVSQLVYVPPPPPPTGTSINLGSGADVLVLKITQDAYSGSAQYTISVDGAQIGGTQTAVAWRGSGEQDTVTVNGTWPSGGHTVTVNFLNDLYGGAAGSDRNLYVESATLNGAAVSGAALSLLSSGAQSFTFTKPGLPPPVGNPGKIDLAVYIGLDPAAYRQFEDWVGVPADGVLAYSGTGSWEDGDPGYITWVFSTLGRKLYYSIPAWPDIGDASVNLAAMYEVANGVHNNRFRIWAQKCLDSRSGDSEPIYVRTLWETGGDWFFYTQQAKTDPAGYIAAFRQFSRSFKSVSSRFKICWDVTADQGPVEQWYPGDADTDIISQDLYWQWHWIGTTNADVAFDVAMNHEHGLNWLTNFSRAHGKQIAISEWGVPGWNVDNPYDGATWINRMRDYLRSNNTAYATYWNADVAYNGGAILSDGLPVAPATALRNIYRSGLTRL